MSLQYHREIFRSAMKIFSTYHSNGSFSTATKWNSSGPLFLRTESPVYVSSLQYIIEIIQINVTKYLSICIMVDCINESSDVTAGHTSRSQVPGAGARIASARHAECHTSHRVTCHQSTNVMGPRFNSTCHGHHRRDKRGGQRGRERAGCCGGLDGFPVLLRCCLAHTARETHQA